jgi:hypothetical protein
MIADHCTLWKLSLRAESGQNVHIWHKNIGVAKALLGTDFFQHDYV